MDLTFGGNTSEAVHEEYGRALRSYQGSFGGRGGPSYWVICDMKERLPEAGEGMDVSGNEGEGDAGRALAVFSLREEAEAFARLRGRNEGFRIREFDGGELISRLYGVWRGFSRVALDPIPEVEHRAADGLVIVSREELVRLLISRVRHPAPRPVR